MAVPLSKEWFNSRKIRLTESQWYNIPVGKEITHRLFHGRPTSAWSENCESYGQKYEPAALRSVQTFINPSDLVIEKAYTLYISKTHAFLAATLDRIIRNCDNDIDSVVEVECPYTCRFTCKRPDWVLQKDNGTYELQYKSRYYYQAQAEMFVTGARQCLFAVYNSRMTYLMVVPRDDLFIKKTTYDLTQYYITTYLPYLIQEEVHIPKEIMEAVHISFFIFNKSVIFHSRHTETMYDWFKKRADEY